MDLVVNRKIYKFIDNKFKKVDDLLAVESPLEIFLDNKVYVTTLRLPDDDINLVKGLLFSKGLIKDVEEIRELYLRRGERTDRIYVQLANIKSNKEDTGLFRNVSPLEISALSDNVNFFVDIPKLKEEKIIDHESLFKVKDHFESSMDLFYKTGCIHAVAIFSLDLRLLAFGEDVGRHNAFDKCIGRILTDKMLSQCYLAICSSRLSFEMVNKAAQLGIQVLVGLSAPTSMSVEYADKWGMTLIGFFRKNRFNIYTHPKRVQRV